MSLSRRATTLAAIALLTIGTAAQAADHTVTIGYQTGAVPYVVGIQDGGFEKATGWKIDFRRFNSGAEIFAAIAGGSVDIGDVGSSPFAASVSNGLDVRAIYITEGAGKDEQLIVRNGANINTLADLRGKRLAAAPVSTDHYMLLSVLKREGIPESDVKFFAIPQPQIVAGWARGDIDAAFVWNPALGELLKTGKSLLTAEQVAARGAPTFSALVVSAKFADQNKDFLRTYLQALDGYYVSYKTEPAKWTASSDNVRKIASLLGGTPEDEARDLAYANFPPASEQVTDKWLGGGDQSGVAKALLGTSAFLKAQGKIGDVADSYGKFVTADYLSAAQHASN